MEALFNYQLLHVEAYVVHIDMVSQNEVAFKLTGADLYTVWDTDTAGNLTADLIGSVSGNSGELVAAEKSFHQDLNGDGMIGNPAIPITIDNKLSAHSER